jgi:hypothetical protein
MDLTLYQRFHIILQTIILVTAINYGRSTLEHAQTLRPQSGVLDAVASILVTEDEVLAVTSTAPNHLSGIASSGENAESTEMGRELGVVGDEEEPYIIEGSVSGGLTVAAVPNPDSKRDQHIKNITRPCLVDVDQNTSWADVERNLVSLATK